MPRKRNKNGVYLTEMGTDIYKEQIYNRFTLTPEGDEPLPGAFVTSRITRIFLQSDKASQQLTAQEQVEKWVDGREKEYCRTAKSDAMRRSTASFMRWRRCASVFPAGSWNYRGELVCQAGAATNKKTLASCARALSGEDE